MVPVESPRDSLSLVQRQACSQDAFDFLYEKRDFPSEARTPDPRVYSPVNQLALSLLFFLLNGPTLSPPLPLSSLPTSLSLLRHPSRPYLRPPTRWSSPLSPPRLAPGQLIPSLSRTARHVCPDQHHISSYTPETLPYASSSKQQVRLWPASTRHTTPNPKASPHLSPHRTRSSQR